MEEVLWNLFKKTGDIKYFILMNKVKNGEDIDFVQEDD